MILASTEWLEPIGGIALMVLAIAIGLGGFYMLFETLDCFARVKSIEGWVDEQREKEKEAK